MHFFVDFCFFALYNYIGIVLIFTECFLEQNKEVLFFMSKKKRAKNTGAQMTGADFGNTKNLNTTRKTMLTVLVSLLGALVWATAVFGTRSLTITVITVLSCVLFEFLYQLIMKKPVGVLDFSAVLTGMLIALGLPVTVELWMLPVAAFFAIVIVKQLFGGFGKNILNPALAAKVFLLFLPGYPEAFTRPGFPIAWSKITLAQTQTDAFTAATPLEYLHYDIIPDITIFDMIIGYHPGCIGEVSALFLTLGGLVLIIRKVITWHIPVSFISTVFVASLFVAVPDVSPITYATYQILSGGLFLGAIFMATDRCTSPDGKYKKLIFGVGCGLITVFIRFFALCPEDVSFAILIMNVLVWYFDRPHRHKAETKAETKVTNKKNRQSIPESSEEKAVYNETQASVYNNDLFIGLSDDDIQPGEDYLNTANNDFAFMLPIDEDMPEFYESDLPIDKKAVVKEKSKKGKKA